MIQSDAALPPTGTPNWRAAALPYRQPRPADAGLQTYWFLAPFRLVDSGDSPSSVVFSSLPNGGKIYINGALAADLGTSTPQVWSRRLRPFMINVAPGVLRQGSNTIAIRFAVHDPFVALGEIRLGPRAALQETFDTVHFWKIGSYQYTNTLCFFMGAFALVFWLRRRAERAHLYFGICALLWGLRTVVAFIPQFPAEYWPLWRTTCYLTTGAFLVCIILAPLRLVGFRSRLLDRVLLAHWILGVAAFALFGKRLQLFIDTAWHAAFLPFAFFMFWQVALNAWRKPSTTHVAMLLTAIGVIGLSLHDLIAMNGWFGTAPVFLLHVGVPALLLAMLCSIMDRLLLSLEATENVNDRLTALAHQREKELLLQYEKQKQLAYQHAANHERQRIMQEMHDGLGAKLVEARELAVDLDAPGAGVAPVLEEALDEMRMVIGSLASSNPDLVAALGEFRYRLIARLTRAGGKLSWRTENLPDCLLVNPYNGMHVLSVLNDAVNSFIRAGAARPLSICIIHQPEWLELQIQGSEHPVSSIVPGISAAVQQRMERRAEAMNATLTLQPGGTGCRLQWRLPAEPAQQQAVA
ncbi:sensor histidine kinase [Noviherbaspirillum humi]|uniref:sensor histidine kinase n=1 Tax=Noviherbaspirillum humi TaxID=1688639 RepID=UPI0011608DD9|nr:hypothetical protein [Noviherbaspirillum humi]